MPEEVDNCVKSVLDDNPEYSESRAYAICWAQKNEGNLAASQEEVVNVAVENNLSAEAANNLLGSDDVDLEDPCWEGYTMVGMKQENGREVPNCVPDDDVPEAELSNECPEGQTKVNGECVPVEDTGQLDPSLSAPVFQLSELDTEPIEREELGENKVAYRNVKVLESGKWTDSASGEEIWYSPKGLENLEIRDNNHINIMHDSGNDVSTVGEMENAKADNGELYADLVLDTSSAAGEYADENLQTALESNGQQGFGGPSVEIDAEGQEIENNEKMGVKELVSGFISGLGLVKNPASKPVHFARQTAERGVALSEGQSPYRLESERLDMADVDLIRDTMSEAGIDVSEMDDEAVMDMAESLHGDLMDALEMAEHGDEEDEDEDEEMEMQGLDESDVVDLIQEEMDDLWGEIDELKEEMMGEDMAEELSEEIEATKEELADVETVQELQDAKDELEKRLSDLEDEPDKSSRKTLSGDADLSESGSEDGHVAFINDPDPY
jgi:hypothetical protein